MPIFKKKNEDFFKIWSPEMAYVLGFFAADGNMIHSKRGNHYLSFSSCDKEILEKIRDVMGCEHKIYCKVAKKIAYRDSYQIQIGSKEIFKDLLKLGFTPNKSLTIKFPKVPEKYFADFVRGYFDGDGHVSTGFYNRKDGETKKHLIFTGFTSGSKVFLRSLHDLLKKNNIVVGGTLYFLKGNRLNFSIRDSLSLYGFLYKNMRNKLYLPRKKTIFEKYMKLRA